MRFLQRNPFFRLLLPLIAGITLVQFLTLTPIFLFVIIGVALLLLLVSLLLVKQNYSYRWLYGVAVMLITCSIGIFLTQERQAKSEFPLLDRQDLFLVEITDHPVEKEKSVLCKVLVMSCINDSTISEIKRKALIYIQKSESSIALKAGDRLLINTIFSRPDGALNPAGFDYAKYLKRQTIGATAYIADYNWELQGKNTQFSIKRLAIDIQQYLLKVYKRFGISGDEYAVLAALTLGSTDALHPDLRQYYSVSGGMHILSVSGLHVGVIYVVFSFIIGLFIKKPRVKAIVCVMFLWFYAIITGLPSSVIRASLMFSLVAIGTGLQRKPQIYNTISLSAFFMLLINPDYLFDVGFQLSYIAVVALIYLQPKISHLFYIKNKYLRWAWDLTAVSIAAQIGTAPLSIYYFNQFPNYFLLTNLFAVPLSTVVIYAAVALFVVSPIPYLSTGVAFVLKWLLIILNAGVEFITELPYPVVISYFTSWQMMLLYVATICFLFFLHNKKFLALSASLSAILIFCAINLSIIVNTAHSNKMLVFAGRQNTHIDFIEGNKHTVFTTDTLALYQTAASYWLSQKIKLHPQNIAACKIQNNYGVFFDKTFYILDNDLSRNFTSQNPVDVDFLIIGNGVKPYAEQIFECFNPKKIISDQSISDWYAEKLREVCEQRGVEYHSVSKLGAFIWEAK
ncbi:MAG: ComEC family competence protein [Paludibacter sp.]|jgi:competence protein ComEC|nr:ComEC family competence protein [Paludibacter sp.]